MDTRTRKKPPTINRWFVLWYLSIRNIWVLGGLAVAIGSFLFLVLRLYVTAPPRWLLVGSLAIGLLVVVNAIRRTYQQLDDSSITPEPLSSTEFEAFLFSLHIPEKLQLFGYQILRGGLGRNIIHGLPFKAASAVSPQLNRTLWRISEQPIPPLAVTIRSESSGLLSLFCKHRTWRLPTLSRPLLSPIVRARSRGSLLANEHKIRLSEDLTPSSSDLTIVIERTDYLSDLVTGQITGIRFIDREGQPYYNGFDLPFEHKPDGWYLKTCREAACSNQLGVSSLVIAVSEVEGEHPVVLQGHVFIVVQAAGNLQSPGLFAPSGSGSLDWSDYEDFGSQFVVEGMVRELLEETSKGDWKALLDRGRTRVILTGFGRMLHRGGKPELYGLVVMPRKAHERGIDYSEQHLVSGFELIEARPLSATSLLTALKQYREANGERLSHPLFVCMTFAEEFLREQASQFDAIVTSVGEYWRHQAQPIVPGDRRQAQLAGSLRASPPAGS